MRMKFSCVREPVACWHSRRMPPCLPSHRHSDGVVMSKPVRLIAAFARNRTIGKNGKLPWCIPEDWEYLLASVRGGVMICGRRCYEELNHAFPGAATSLVLSRRPDLKYKDATVCNSMRRALDVAQHAAGDVIWIGGGEHVYAEAMPIAGELWATMVDANVDGDTKFPDGWQAHFPREVSRRSSAGAGFSYDFVVFSR